VSRLLVALHRLAHALRCAGVPVAPLLIALFNRFVFGCWIGPGARLGKRISLGYGGLGVVIHDKSVIGDDVRIGTQVVIGGRSKHPDVPVIGDRCVIATGAKLLGPLHIGADSVVGANAVVVKDVAPRTVVGGVPARVLRTDIDIREYHDGLSVG